MEQPELPSDGQALHDLQVELDNRGIVLPKSLMPLGDRERTMSRFLRARKMNVTAAADMLQNTVNWRKEANIEECLETFLPDDKDNKLRRFLPSGFIGHDKTGSPVWMEHAAAIDVAGMEAAGISLEDFVYYHCRAMEYMVNCKYCDASDKAGHPVVSHCVILDLAGLRLNMLNQNTIKVFKSMSGIYQDHYPELMSRMFLVNIPLMFAAVWKVLQMFLDDRVKAKIRFLRKADFHTLHEFVDRDSLPEGLGGKSKEKLLSDKLGYLPASLLAVNTEVQRRIDARDRLKQEEVKDEHREEAMHMSPSDPVETPVIFNSHDSMPPVNFNSIDSVAGVDESRSVSSMHTSGSTSDLDSEASTSNQTFQVASHQPVGMTDAEALKLAGLRGAAQQAQQATSHQPDTQQPASAAAAAVNISAKADSQKAAAPAEGKQRRKSKREKARGLLSSFTHGSRKHGESQEDMNQALQMLSEMRRTESSPNVEAEALKRSKGGGGPWMSFTRRTPKPRSAKKGGGSPIAGGRKGSPLATVVSVDAEAMAGAADAAAGNSPGARSDHSRAAERSSPKKWNPFCVRPPLVQGDDDGVITIDSRRPKANGNVPAGGFPPSADSATLTERLARKLSAIPAYLQSSEDPEGLRVASTESSSTSLSGSSPSAFFLQRDVVGRYASAPNLEALVGDNTSLSASQRAVPETTPARAPPPAPSAQNGVSRSLSSSQGSVGHRPWNVPQAGGATTHTVQPMGETSGETRMAYGNANQLYVQKVIHDHGRQTALQRRVRHCLKYLIRNWVFLLALAVSMACMWLAVGHGSHLSLAI